MMLRKIAFAGLFALAQATAACAPQGDEDTTGTVSEPDPDEIVGTNSVARNMSVQGFVLVRTGASTSEVTSAVQRQVRVLFGAAKAIEIGLSDRDGNNIDTSTFVRDTVTVVDPANTSATPTRMDRVRYTYRDSAVVVRSLATRRTIGTSTLFGNYNSYSDEVIQNCQTENQDWGSSGIWYNYTPTLSGCKALVDSEASRINTERRSLTDPDHQVTVSEVNRHFLPVTMRFTGVRNTTVKYPDYHRLFAGDHFIAYSFFGIDKEDDANDYGARNYFGFLRSMLSSQLNLRVQGTTDGTNLLNVVWQGTTIPNVTYDRIIGWILDNRDLPTQVTYANRSAFRLQILRQWRGHFVKLGMNANVTINGASHPVAIEIRSYYGDEESWNSGAIARYRAAFADANFFQYTGHSHLGSGPLDARNYTASNFADQYQIIMANSCVSFNYYNDYFDMHPGGTRNLDTITNGLPVYLEGSGISSARILNALIDGRWRSYADVLGSARIDLPWESSYDPNRVADGETDNTYSPSRYTMSISTSAIR